MAHAKMCDMRQLKQRDEGSRANTRNPKSGGSQRLHTTKPPKLLRRRYGHEDACTRQSRQSYCGTQSYCLRKGYCGAEVWARIRLLAQGGSHDGAA